MNISSAFSSGLAGYQSASNQLSVASDRVANAGVTDKQSVSQGVSSETQPVSITEEVINMKVAELQAKASVNVISTADEMVGTLIDTTV